jgi:hypothetical protein
MHLFNYYVCEKIKKYLLKLANTIKTDATGGNDAENMLRSRAIKDYNKKRK